MPRVLPHLSALSMLLLLGGCSTVTDTVDGWMGESGPKMAKLQSYQAEVAPLELWSQGVGEGSGGVASRLQPAIDNSRLYVAEFEGEVKAVSLPGGESLWSVTLSEHIMSGVAVDEENLYVGTESGKLLALDRNNGSERWSVNLLSEILAPAAAASGRVVVRTADGKLTALERTEGKQLWQYEREVPVLTLRGTSAPLVTADKVYAGLDSGEVVALSLEDGREQWIKPVTTPRGRTEIERMVDIDANPVIVGDTLYVVGFQGNLVALNAESGELLWKRQLSSLMTPAIQAKYLFVSDQEGAVWAFDRQDGSALWKQDGLLNRAPSPPLADGRYVVVGDGEGYLHWLAVEDGRFAGRMQLDSAGFAVPALDYGEGVVSYSKSGRLSLVTR